MSGTRKNERKKTGKQSNIQKQKDEDEEFASYYESLHTAQQQYEDETYAEWLDRLARGEY